LGRKSIGRRRPFATNSPSQSWAPTMISGPSPVGAEVMNLGLISPKLTSFTSTWIPYF